VMVSGSGDGDMIERSGMFSISSCQGILLRQRAGGVVSYTGLISSVTHADCGSDVMSVANSTSKHS